MSAPLQFGYLIPTRDAVMRARDGRADVRRMVARTQGHEAGEPERCAAFLREFARVGARHFVVRFAASDQEKQMDRLLAEVAPLLSGT